MSREKREERRDKKELQRRQPQSAGANPFLGHAAGVLDLWRLHFGTAGRGKRAEKRKKTEESPKEAARGPQMRPQEVPKEGGMAQKRVGP